MCNLDSLPVVVTADANGVVCIWAVRGMLSPYRYVSGFVVVEHRVACVDRCPLTPCRRGWVVPRVQHAVSLAAHARGRHCHQPVPAFAKEPQAGGEP